MPTISFALILSDTLKNKNIKVSQIESEIEVKGQLDPYQLQRIRDQVSESFQQRRKNLNDFILKKAAEAAKEKDPKKRVEIIRQADAQIAKSVRDFDKKIQTEITAFCEKDEELRQAGSGTWSYLVSTAWQIGSLVWNGSKASVETGAGLATGGATAALAVKSLIDLALDFKKFWESQTEAWRSVERQQQLLQDALTKIRKTKKGTPVALSDAQAAEAALAPFGPKIDALEKTTRGFSLRLDAMLKDGALRTVKDKKALKKIEDAIDALVRKVADLGEAVTQKRALQKRAKDSIRTAMAKAKADPTSWLTWAAGIYDKINDLMDVTSEAEDIYSAIKQCVIVFQSVQEALAEED